MACDCGSGGDGHDERVAPRTSASAAVLLAVLASCADAQPWDASTWRPEAAPQRVVAGSVLAAESLLGVLPKERLAAAHLFAANSGYSLAADLTDGVRLIGATPEQLLSVDPDLVLVDAYTRAETLALLGAAGVPVVRTRDPHGFEDIAANLRTIGRVTHLEAELEAVITAMQQRLHGVRRRGEGLAAWRLLSLDGALHTYGEGSLFDAIARAAGATNVAAEHGVGSFRKLDIEEVLAWRPDAIVLSGEPGQDTPAWVDQFPGLDLLPCVAGGRLLFVPGPLLSTTSHHLVDAAASLQRQLEEWGSP
jgi:ABC-type Fe3+-hydroxamate transport system substrate-binding protein